MCIFLAASVKLELLKMRQCVAGAERVSLSQRSSRTTGDFQKNLWTYQSPWGSLEFTRGLRTSSENLYGFRRYKDKKFHVLHVWSARSVTPEFKFAISRITCAKILFLKYIYIYTRYYIYRQTRVNSIHKSLWRELTRSLFFKFCSPLCKS